ncbi:hypothetical protein HDU97_009224 [Phlyctochytrium planicorne]|nr:hypothetical protein HDU97_009224 [Phlyctochytrium planicorne]
MVFKGVRCLIVRDMPSFQGEAQRRVLVDMEDGMSLEEFVDVIRDAHSIEPTQPFRLHLRDLKTGERVSTLSGTPGALPDNKEDDEVWTDEEVGKMVVSSALEWIRDNDRIGTEGHLEGHDVAGDGVVGIEVELVEVSMEVDQQLKQESTEGQERQRQHRRQYEEHEQDDDNGASASTSSSCSRSAAVPPFGHSGSLASASISGNTAGPLYSSSSSRALPPNSSTVTDMFESNIAMQDSDSATARPFPTMSSGSRFLSSRDDHFDVLDSIHGIHGLHSDPMAPRRGKAKALPDDETGRAEMNKVMSGWARFRKVPAESCSVGAAGFGQPGFGGFGVGVGPGC